MIGLYSQGLQIFNVNTEPRIHAYRRVGIFRHFYTRKRKTKDSHLPTAATNVKT